MVDQFGMGYVDAYQMPSSRRRRLMQWKAERIEQENAQRKAEMSKKPRMRR